MNATARAQAHRTLEQLVQSLKRQQRATKDAIQVARQAQVELLGIHVETELERSTVDNHQDTQHHQRDGAGREA